MPLLRLGEQPLDPGAAFAHRPLEGRCTSIGADTLKQWFVKGPAKQPSLATRRALLLHRAPVADCRSRSIQPLLALLVSPPEMQRFTLRAAIDVLTRLVG